VAGSRKQFGDLLDMIPGFTEGSKEADEFVGIEDFHIPAASEKIKPLSSGDDLSVYEVVLHAGKGSRASVILEKFEEFLVGLGVSIDITSRIDAGDLSFVPLECTRSQLEDAATFSFVRLARDMPSMRTLTPNDDIDWISSTVGCILPQEGPIDPSIRVAIFDGGYPVGNGLDKWVSVKEIDGLGPPLESRLKHGLAVTSAVLFGPLEEGVLASRPYCHIDHYRVYDDNSSGNPKKEAYPVLKRIISVLEAEKYDFVNLSVGPKIPMDDEDVHPWTASLDPFFVDGKTLATVACGNDGTANPQFNLNRIQPPSDLVNAFAVGACTRDSQYWRRAPYSCVGHGRSPGYIKPDGVVFGGENNDPYLTVGYGDHSMTSAVLGTSFSAPTVLRAAIGMRAHLGSSLGALAIKALLVHASDPGRNHASEVGWGKINTDVDELITCAAGEAHIIYQGTIEPKKFIRADIPVPEGGFAGPLTIEATMCFATKTDPHHPFQYTRSGVRVFYRPDKTNKKPGKKEADTQVLFRGFAAGPVSDLRQAPHIWETVQKGRIDYKSGTKVSSPVLDIHYNPREEGADTSSAEPIPYAMVVSIKTPEMPDVYDALWAKYQYELQELKSLLVPPIELDDPSY
jgi:hypothetical protein